MGDLFGKEEKLTCIVDVPLKGAKDEPVCLAYKTTMYAGNEAALLPGSEIFDKKCDWKESNDSITFWS